MTNEDEQNNFFEEAMHFTVDDLQNQFVKVAAEFAYFAGLYGKANKNYLIAKVNRERTEAHKYQVIRHEQIEQNGKTTEKQVEAAIKTDAEYSAAVETEVLAMAKRDDIRTKLDGCRIKKDVLVSLGAAQRTEREGDIYIRQ